MQTRLDRADLKTGNVGDFLICKTFEKGQDNHQTKIFGEIIDRRGIWKTRMSLEEARLVETICEPLMVEFGYLPQRASGFAAFAKRLALHFEKKRIAVVSRWGEVRKAFSVCFKKLVE